MENSKQKISRFSAILFGASIVFLTGSGAAYALPASLDAHTALVSNDFTLRNKAGDIYYSQMSENPVNFEFYTKALTGNPREVQKLSKPLKSKIFVKSGKIEIHRHGKNLRVNAQNCHYALRFASAEANAQGIISHYKISKKLPKNCAAGVPVSATEKIALKARLINSSKGVYQLPVQPDGSSVSAVLSTLAPTDRNDAGLFGYTYFIKYADGTALNWGTAGIMSNKLALGKSHMTVSYLIAEAVGQGAARLSKVGIHLGSPSLEAPTLKAVAPKPCDYQMFLDKPSIRHKEGALSVDFEAPKLSGVCLKGKNPLSVTMTVEPLNIDPDGSNKMVVEKMEMAIR